MCVCCGGWSLSFEHLLVWVTCWGGLLRLDGDGWWGTVYPCCPSHPRPSSLGGGRTPSGVGTVSSFHPGLALGLGQPPCRPVCLLPPIRFQWPWVAFVQPPWVWPRSSCPLQHWASEDGTVVTGDELGQCHPPGGLSSVMFWMWQNLMSGGEGKAGWRCSGTRNNATSSFH